MTDSDDTTTMVAVKDLRPGDRVDLEGDMYANPDDPNTICSFEYLEVAAIEAETPGCWRVDIESFDSVGFPPDHMLKVVTPRPDWTGVEYRVCVDGSPLLPGQRFEGATNITADPYLALARAMDIKQRSPDSFVSIVIKLKED